MNPLLAVCQLLVLPFAAVFWLAMLLLRALMIALLLVCTLGLAAPFLLPKRA